MGVHLRGKTQRALEPLIFGNLETISVKRLVAIQTLNQLPLVVIVAEASEVVTHIFDGVEISLDHRRRLSNRMLKSILKMPP